MRRTLWMYAVWLIAPVEDSLDNRIFCVSVLSDFRDVYNLDSAVLPHLFDFVFCQSETVNDCRFSVSVGDEKNLSFHNSLGLVKRNPHVSNVRIIQAIPFSPASRRQSKEERNISSPPAIRRLRCTGDTGSPVSVSH